ncbi:mechanosensitive ion channel family protein [Christensenella timonensis]|uniref:mechanosensitive ion channel family protein n=1 Tax=Christensenella timonensis TaxID=1816678 RepID=UPI000833B8E9|nr:mechanosensitive ion channel family protein [Christensenella timonensis]
MNGDTTTQIVDKTKDFFENFEKMFSLGFWNTLIFAAVVAGITFIILKLLSKFLKKHLTGNMRIFYRLIYVVVIVIAVFSVLMTIEPLKQFATVILASSGIAGVVIGLAAQTTLGNVFSGISIGVSKPFELGDYVEIIGQNVAGVVDDIGLRHTVIRTLDNKHVVIPNGVLDKDMVLTSHGLPDQAVNNQLNVGISYDSDIDLAIKIISDAAYAHTDTIDRRTDEEKKNGTPKILIRITDFAPSAVMLRAFIWTKDLVTGNQVLSDLRYTIKKQFDEQGITIPYQTQTILLEEKKDGK